MSIRTGDVYYKNKQAGVLEETPKGGTRFIYDDKYLETIACVFPRHKQSFEWDYGVHPFFENLAPEGWLREKQARVGGVQPKDTLGILLAYGENCIGAVGIKNVTDGKHIDVSGLDTETRLATNAHRTVSGIQRKLLAYKKGGKYYPATQDSPANYIAKLNHENNITLVLNENLSLRLASDVLGKDEVTKFQLSFLEELNEVALLIERFDRTADEERLRMEDFAQILNKPRGNDYKGKYIGSYEEIAESIKEYSSFPLIDIDRFFKQLIFSCLVGNCDAHLKNFALLEVDGGLRLSPAYDILNTILYPEKGYDTSLALELCGQKREWDTINRKIITEFGQSVGLTNKAIELALKQITNNINRSSSLSSNSNISHDDFHGKYKEILDSACLRILTI